MNTDSKAENKPFLFIKKYHFFKNICYSKVFFIIGLCVFLIAIAYGLYFTTFKSPQNINKILISRESMLNSALIKSENQNDILEAEKLLLENELKIAVKNFETKEFKKISKYHPLSTISGNGVEIILSDNNSEFQTVQNEKNIIHNTDLLKIVNFLWTNNAKAISINGERIGQNTAIDCIGATILINNKRINSPFNINAVCEKITSDMIKNSTVVLSLLLRGIQVEVRELENMQISPKQSKNIEG